MAQLDFLIQDAFTFLSLLASHDVRPVGSRYLPPSALARLNALLVVPDSFDIEHRRNSNGRWRLGVRSSPSERQQERIRFLHYLAESAHLVARTGAFLKPTPSTARWLNASDAQRVHTLFHAAFPARPTQADHDRWRALNLPGSHLPAPLAACNQLLDLLRQAPRGERIKVTTLRKLLALPAYDDDPPERDPETTLRAWLKLLQWFEVVSAENASTVQLTSIGRVLLECSDSASLPPPRTLRAKPFHWSKPRDAALPNLIAPLDADFPTLWELGEYAAPLSVLSSARTIRRLYQLDPERVRRALDHGKTIAGLYAFLERATGDALPRAVADWLYRIGREYGRVTLRSVTLLEVDDAKLLTELTRAKYIRQCLRRTLSPRAVVVRPSRLDALARLLQRRGYRPRLELSPTTEVATSVARPHAHTQFDHPTLAHLYVSARLTHQLASVIPAPYRPPYSILLDLEKQLTARDRAMAEELINECIQEMNPRAAPRQAALPPRFDEGGPGVAVAIESIQRALQTRTPLEITYYSPYSDETTTRRVEPLRLEYRDNIPYLIAYCHRVGDERTFRVNRILQLTPGAAANRGTILRK